MSNPPQAYGNDRVEPGPNGSRLLHCDVSKGWLPRKAGTLTSVEHPGTAVRWQDEIFEVVEAAGAPQGGTRYRLEPWNSHHAIRVVLGYDAETEAARDNEQQARRISVHSRRLSILLSPLLGHLPGPVQEKMEGDFGAPARWMTIASALPLFVVGGLGVLNRVAAGFGAETSLPPVFAPPFPLAVYWCVESAVRLFSSFLQGIPMGSLPGVLAYELWRNLFGRGEASIALPARPSRWRPADTFKMLEPLLALLSPEEQELLERRFEFDSLKWGRRSAVLVGIVAALNLVISLGMLAQARATFWDALWLVAGGYLCVEQLARLRRIGRGYPAGSALGALVRPMARGLLSPIVADRTPPGA